MTDGGGGSARVAASLGAGVEGSPSSNGRVLVVCTGNVCRSPYMERRLRQALLGTGVEVVSAGTAALTGEKIDAKSVELLRLVGARSEDFAATQLTAQIVASADLVLTVSRKHRAEVVQLYPRALRYCFTWTDFADLVRGIGPAEFGLLGSDRTWAAHVSEVAAARRGTIPARSELKADIVDPYRRGTKRFSVMARQIDEGLPSIVATLIPR